MSEQYQHFIQINVIMPDFGEIPLSLCFYFFPPLSIRSPIKLMLAKHIRTLSVIILKPKIILEHLFSQYLHTTSTRMCLCMTYQCVLFCVSTLLSFSLSLISYSVSAVTTCMIFPFGHSEVDLNSADPALLSSHCPV